MSIISTKKTAIVSSFIYLLVNSCAVANSVADPGQPEVFALNASALSANKKKIKVGDEIAATALKQLIKEADKALKFGPVSVMEKKNIPPSGSKHDYMSLAPYHWPDPSKPNGLPYIRKDGQTNPEVHDYKDKEYMPELCDNVHKLALAYYFSNDKIYAEHAARLVRVWFLDTATRMNPNLNYAQAIKGENTGRGAGIIDSRHFIKLVDAIGLFKESKYWSKEDQEGMKKWFSEYLRWMQTSANGIDEMDTPNNHGAWYDALRLSLALFTGDMELAKKIVRSAQDRLDKQMDENGSFPKEMERTTSFHYTTFATEAFFTIANMAEATGIDFWHFTTPSGKSLEKGFNTLRPYLVKEKQWQGQQIKDFDFEEGYFLLMEGALHFNCKNCVDAVRQLAGDRSSRLLLTLLY